MLTLVTSFAGNVTCCHKPHKMCLWHICFTLSFFVVVSQVEQVVKEFGGLQGWFMKMRNLMYRTPTMMNLLRLVSLWSLEWWYFS